MGDRSGERRWGEAAGLAFVREGSGPALLLLHGFCSTAESWLPVLPSLARSFDVIAPTWPGFGGGDRFPPCASITEMVDRLIIFAGSLGLKTFNVIGHSMSGFVVQELLCRHASRVEKVVLYGSGLKADRDARFEPLATTIERLQRDGPMATAQRVCGTWFAAGTQAAAYGSCVAQGASMRVDAGVAALRAASDCDFTGRLAVVAQDVLVLLGDRDRTFRVIDGVDLAAAMPHACLCVLPGCAHAVHLERPELFSLVVLDFLQRRLG